MLKGLFILGMIEPLVHGLYCMVTPLLTNGAYCDRVCFSV